MKKRSSKSSLEAIRNYGFTKDVYREELMTQLEQLNILGEEMEKIIMVGNGRVGSKEITGPSGNERIRASNSNGCRQFYFFDPASHKKRYAKVSELQQIIVSAQKEYDTKAFEKIRKLKDTLQKFLKNYDIEEIEKIYDNYCKAKQEIISPLILPKETFVKEWRETHKGNQNTYPTEILYQTALGENVRSKSEKIVSMESEIMPLDVKIIEKKIRTYLT